GGGGERGGSGGAVGGGWGGVWCGLEAGAGRNSEDEVDLAGSTLVPLLGVTRAATRPGMDLRALLLHVDLPTVVLSADDRRFDRNLLAGNGLNGNGAIDVGDGHRRGSSSLEFPALRCGRGGQHEQHHRCVHRFLPWEC